MVPRHVAFDISATMEILVLRLPLTEAASSHQTTRYAHIIRKGRTVVLTLSCELLVTCPAMVDV
jgi:hypothetical protein